MNLPHIRWGGHFRRAPGETQSDELVDRGLEDVRNAETDTKRAWSRLAMALDGDRVRFREGAGKWIRVPLRPVVWSGFGIALAVAALFLLLPRESDRIYATARAQQSAVLLPDSTLVTLNHTSKLKVQPPGSDGTRVVTLEGEAYFQVHRNGTPFIVRTGAGNVEVLGTSFNVRARNQSTDLEVLHGRVRFGAGRNGSVILTEDQRSRCIAGQEPSRPVPAGHRVAPAWLEGKLACDHQRLPDVCRELEETYDIVIIIEDPALHGVSVTGTIEARTAQTALAALCLLTGHRYRQDHATFVVY